MFCQEIYYIGEDLFGVPHQRYPALDTTRQELGYLSQLYASWIHLAAGHLVTGWVDRLVILSVASVFVGSNLEPYPPMWGPFEQWGCPA